MLDPEPYSKVVSTIVAGAVLLSAGGFAAIRILTHHKPPKVTLSPRGFEIAANRGAAAQVVGVGKGTDVSVTLEGAAAAKNGQ